jgi:predicted nucleotidyltransferase
MQIAAQYPTPFHAQAAQAITDFFQSHGRAAAVLLVNSCARGKATPDSCLDIITLIEPEMFAAQGAELEAAWQTFYQTAPVFARLRQAGAYSVVHLDLINGVYTPTEWDDGGGPDGFELEVGNHLAYSVPLWQGGDYLARLKAQWLPYYGEDLRQKRLAMVCNACREDLAHIPLYVDRELYFAAFDRLFRAVQEFLQALFISRRTYPIAYNKWIREQLETLAGLPDLYMRLLRLHEISRFDSPELVTKVRDLEAMLNDYVTTTGTSDDSASVAAAP